MKRVFADTAYWIALVHRKDQWHQRALEVSQQLGSTILVTTDEVLDEFLAFFSAFGNPMRVQCARIVRDLMIDPAIVVVPQSRHSFESGLALYDARPDK